MVWMRQTGVRPLVDSFQTHYFHQFPSQFAADDQSVPALHLSLYLASSEERILSVDRIDLVHQIDMPGCNPEHWLVVGGRARQLEQLALADHGQVRITPDDELTFPISR